VIKTKIVLSFLCVSLCVSLAFALLPAGRATWQGQLELSGGISTGTWTLEDPAFSAFPEGLEDAGELQAGSSTVEAGLFGATLTATNNKGKISGISGAGEPDDEEMGEPEGEKGALEAGDGHIAGGEAEAGPEGGSDASDADGAEEGAGAGADQTAVDGSTSTSAGDSGNFGGDNQAAGAETQGAQE